MGKLKNELCIACREYCRDNLIAVDTEKKISEASLDTNIQWCIESHVKSGIGVQFVRVTDEPFASYFKSVKPFYEKNIDS